MLFFKIRPFILFFISTVFFQQQASAELIFAAPPRESAKQARKLYTPLIQHLSKLLGEKVIFQPSRNWLHYQRDIRRDKFDIIFDGPHFASWRILHLEHNPLVKLPGKLDFYFITKKSSKNIRKPDDLVLKKVCAIPPPNLTSLVLLNVLNSPIREPIIKSVKGGMPKVFKDLNSDKCVAAVVRQDFFNKRLSQNQRDKYRIIYTSGRIPNQVITASSRISKIKQDKIIDSLTSSKGRRASAAILKRFGGKRVKSFILADKNDFKGQNELLEGVILGW